MRLGLFLTLGNSLATWRDAGTLDRELALYREHARNGITTAVVSYGGFEEARIASGYPWLRVLYNHWPVPKPVYAMLVALFHRAELRQMDVFKTNQMYGAAQAWHAARLAGRPLIVRQGYSHCENRCRESGAESRVAKKACAYERTYLRRADACVFTTAAMRERALARVDFDPRRAHVVPNYVMTEAWSPAFMGRRSAGEMARLRIGCVGRLSAEKNLGNLIQACAGLPVELCLVGDGPLRAELEQQADRLGVTVEFRGQMAHGQVRAILEGCDVFAIVSKYEGHPKSLIEAMVYGMPILAVNSPGIRELVEHGQRGYLAEPDVSGLRAGVTSLLEMPLNARLTMGTNARRWASEQFSVQAVAAKEAELIRSLVGRHHG